MLIDFKDMDFGFRGFVFLHPIESYAHEFGADSLPSIGLFDVDGVDFSELNCIDGCEAIGDNLFGLEVFGEDCNKLFGLVFELLHAGVELDAVEAFRIDGVDFEVISLLFLPKGLSDVDLLNATDTVSDGEGHDRMSGKGRKSRTF